MRSSLSILTIFFVLQFTTFTLKGQTPSSGVSTLTLNKVPLRVALEKFSDLYDVDILFADAIVENIVISVDLSGLSFESSLLRLLAGTRLGFKRVTKKQLIFYDKTRIDGFDITGRVLDSGTGETLPYANVQIFGTSAGTSSNQEGRFSLLGLPAKSCTVQVSYLGYLPALLAIDATNLAPDVNIKLHQTAVQLQNVTVQDENWQVFQINSSVSQLALSPRHFSDLPILGDKDLFRTMQYMPGISTGENGASGVNMRGSTPNENLVLLDGMILYQLDHSFGFVSSINSDAIKDVRVYKGGFPAKYGGRISGIVDLTAKNGDFNRVRLNGGINRISSQLKVELPLAGKGAVLFAARKSHSSDILKQIYFKLFDTPPFFADDFLVVSKIIPSEDSTSTDSLPNFLEMNQSAANDSSIQGSKITFHDYISKITLMPGKNDLINLSLYLGEDEVLRGVDDGFQFRDEKSNWGSKGISARWNRAWNSRFTSTLLLTYSDYFWDFQDLLKNTFTEIDSGSFVTSYQNDLNNLRLQWNGVWQYNEPHFLQFGLSVERNSVLFKEDYDFSGPDNSFNQDSHGNQVSVFFQDRWQIFDKLQFTPGLRATHYDLTSSEYWEPRLAMQYQLVNNVYLKASWGRFYQFLLNGGGAEETYNLQKSWLLAESQFLKPANAEHRIAGLNWEINNFLLDIEFYFKKQNNLLEKINQFDTAEPTTSVLGIVNQRNSIAKGVDMVLKKKAGKFTGWLSYSYNQTHTQPDAFNDFTSHPANSDIPHDFKIVSNYRWQGWNIAATWQWTSGRVFSKPIATSLGGDDFFEYYEFTNPSIRNQDRLPATSHLDFSIYKRLMFKSISGKIGLSIFNLLNRTNTWYRHYKIDDEQLQFTDVEMFGFTSSFNLELYFN